MGNLKFSFPQIKLVVVNLKPCRLKTWYNQATRRGVGPGLILLW
jgi:hypothetical protein